MSAPRGVANLGPSESQERSRTQSSGLTPRDPQRVGPAGASGPCISHFPGDLAAGVQSRYISGTVSLSSFASTPDWDQPPTNRCKTHSNPTQHPTPCLYRETCGRTETQGSVMVGPCLSECLHVPFLPGTSAVLQRAGKQKSQLGTVNARTHGPELALPSQNTPSLG